MSGVKVFDPNQFSKRIGRHLSDTFTKMSIIIGISLILFLLIFFADVRITLTVAAPIVFALVCTLGTLRIIDHPLDIPGLMLSIVVMGMGIDYSIYFVRSRQRYRDASHPSFGIIRLAVTLTSISTIIGFGVMCFSEHTLLKSAGITSLVGIAYALCGAFLILPFLLDKLFTDDSAAPAKPRRKGSDSPPHVLARYRHMETYPRFFARFKLKLDPMFAELDLLLDAPGKTIDIGTGYGVPAAWLLTRFEDTRIFGIDPDPEKVRIASLVVRHRGTVEQGRAPDIPLLEGPADTALMIDMIHYLKDDEFKLTLERLHIALKPGGILLIRGTIPSGRRFPWMRWIEAGRLKLFQIAHVYRTPEEIEQFLFHSGFREITRTKSGTDREEVWFRAVAAKEA